MGPIWGPGGMIREISRKARHYTGSIKRMPGRAAATS